MSKRDKRAEIEIMIVIVENRKNVSEAYISSIGREGYAAISFNPQDFISWFHSTTSLDLSAVDGIVLGECGERENITRAIRRQSEVPALALSEETALEHTLKLFAAGVDDVVRKPVHAREIIARICAIRRRQVNDSQCLWNLDGLMIFGDGRGIELNGQFVQVPRRELRILEYLAKSKNRRVSRSQIFNAVYGLLDENVEESVVECHISKLRKKLRTALGYDPIDTQRFLGYQLVGRSVMAA
jgi:two-component system, OmpR family, flagellar system response regulator FtcR